MTLNYIQQAVDKGVEEFDKHLSESAPSMDKFEKAAALNKVRTFAREIVQAVKEGMPERNHSRAKENGAYYESEFDNGFNACRSDALNPLEGFLGEK